MPFPTQITDHVDQAIARLISILRDKPKVLSMFRSLSSRMVLVPSAEDNTSYGLTINGTDVWYTSPTTGTTMAFLVQKIMDEIRTASLGVTCYPSIESDDIFYICSTIPGVAITVTWINALP